LMIGMVKLASAQLPASSVALTMNTAFPAGSRTLAEEVVRTVVVNVNGSEAKLPLGHALLRGPLWYWRTSLMPRSSSEVTETRRYSLGVPSSEKRVGGRRISPLGEVV